MKEFAMPSLGADMEAGTLVEWLKHPGERVSRGDIVAVVETEKGAIEIEIFDEGVIDRTLVEVGARVPVGTPLALLRDAEEAPAAAPAPTPAIPIPAAPPAPLAAAPKPAAIRAAPAPTAPPAGAPAARPLASPAARRLAAERGVELGALRGSGPGGAVVSADVEAAAAPAAPPAVPRHAGIDVAAMRRAIAAAMSRSKREIPHYYLTTTIGMARAMGWLQAANAQQPPAQRLLVSALLLKAVAVSLHDFPELNGTYVDGRFQPAERVHLGVAIALRGGGLVAPAIHDADRLTLDELTAALRALVGRVRAGTMRSSEMADPTITVTSLGERGVEGILPVIYPPQVAIVGLGGIHERPWAVDGALAVRPVVAASLAADHRVSDGHRGSLFLARLAETLQQPGAL
jgi:pyruvate dehydrogenase E2 component (dihydrolipoamide acetyltransferase)